MGTMPFKALKLSAPAQSELVPGSPPWDDFIQCEWSKPREYSFTNAAGKVFYEIAYSRQDVNAFAKMHKAVSYRPTEDSLIRESIVAD